MDWEQSFHYSKHYPDQYISNYFLMDWDNIFSLFHSLFGPIYFQLFSDELRSNLFIIPNIIQTNIFPIIFWLIEIKSFHYSKHYSRPINFQLFSDELRWNLFIFSHIIQTNIFPIIFWWTEIKSFHYSTHYSDQYISNYFLMNWDQIFSLFHTLFRPIYFQLFSDELRSNLFIISFIIQTNIFPIIFWWTEMKSFHYSKHYSHQYISNYFLIDRDQIFSLFHTLFRPIFFQLFSDGLRAIFSLFHSLFRPIYFQLFSDGLRSNLFINTLIIQTNIFPILFWWTEIKCFHYSKHYPDQYISNYFLMDWDKIFSLFQTLFRPIYFQLFSDGLRSNLFIIPLIIQTNIFPIIFWRTAIKYFHFSTHYSDQYISNYFLTDWDEMFSLFHSLLRRIYFQLFSDRLRSNLFIIPLIIRTNIFPIIFWWTEIKSFHYSTHYSDQYISNYFLIDWDQIFSLFHSLFRPIYFQLFSDGLRAIFSLFHTLFRPIYFRLFSDGMRSNLFIIPHIIKTNIFPILFWWIEIKSFPYSTHYSDQYISNYFLLNWDQIFSLFHTLFRPIYFQLFSDELS